jgi:hypothetical protein
MKTKRIVVNPNVLIALGYPAIYEIRNRHEEVAAAAERDRLRNELATERARLDWLDTHLNYELMITVFGEKIGLASDGGPRELRSAIDSAMKEDAK